MPEAAPDVDRAAGLLGDWGESPALRALAAIVMGIVAMWATGRLAARLAGSPPSRSRSAVVPWGQALQLLLALGVAGYVATLALRPAGEGRLAIAIALGLVVGLACRAPASGLVAGVVVLLGRPYRVGDRVRVGGVSGEVRSIGLRAVELLAADGSRVLVPHAAIWSGPIHREEDGRRDLPVVADFYLQPDHDGEAVRRALHDVALTSPYLRLGSPVSVVAAEEPWGTHYRLKAVPIDGRDHHAFLTDLTVRGKAVFRRLGVRHATAPPSPRGLPLAR